MVFFLLTGQGSSKQSPPLPRLPARGACTVPSPVGQWGYLEKVQQLSVGGGTPAGPALEAPLPHLQPQENERPNA